MHINVLSLLGGAAVALVIVGPAAAQTSVGVGQADAPLEIVSYGAGYSDYGTPAERGISHHVEYRNKTSRKVVAVQIGFVEFDIWNEFLAVLRGTDMDGVAAGKVRSATFTHNPYGAFSFHRGIAFISKVRFDDGEIWSANLDKIFAEIQKTIDSDLSLDSLKKKDAGK